MIPRYFKDFKSCILYDTARAFVACRNRTFQPLGGLSVLTSWSGRTQEMSYSQIFLINRILIYCHVLFKSKPMLATSYFQYYTWKGFKNNHLV